ncbi:MAG: hypothetical protein B6D61_08405 [Bacteroidetes bacterium 4484_249]|nr:MAG: hypothetical protein B6D61_08405 [Bacteroidetes bacterium 4484_249]OYT13170.1 MAG: hypothetical protein B6I19_06460 [Bacteroidetes bacterium 4572_114]
MNKFKLLTATTIFALFAGAVLMHSCSKQEITDKPVTGNGEVAMSGGDINFQNKLVRFRDKVGYIKEHPGFKSGEVMSVDSVVWYLEATINYTYGHPDRKCNEIYNYADSVYLNNSSSGEATLDDIVLVHDLIISKIGDYYYNINEEQKDFILTDISKSETQNGQTKLSFTASVGSGWDNYLYPFDETDFWYYGQGMGKCGPYGGNFGEDAATKIFYLLPYYQPIFDPGPGYMVVYSDVETIDSHILFDENPEFFRNPGDPEPVDNWLDYYMFYASSEYGDENLDENEECLDTLEMNFYFNGVQTMIYNKFPAITDPPDKTYMQCTSLEGKFQSDDYSGVIFHEGDFKYGIRHIIPVTGDIPVDLPF